MINIRTYQEFCKIPSGITEMEVNKQVAELIGLDITKFTYNEITEKVKEWMNKISISKIKRNYIRLGKKWYKVDRDLYSLIFSQWIYFDDTMRVTNDGNITDILHFIISTFLRECRFYKFFPKKFDVNNIEKLSKEVQEYLPIETALELTNFFFRYMLNFMRNGKIEYLEGFEKMINSDKMTD